MQVIKWAMLLYHKGPPKKVTVLGFVEAEGSPSATLKMMELHPDAKTNHNYFVKPADPDIPGYYKKSVPFLEE